MKTALLHYWLTNMRGGENVFREICEMFPEGDIYTHAYRPDRVSCFSSRVLHESFIARLPFGRMKPQVYLPLMPRASRALKLNDYELIISSESGPIKGITKPKDARHICYCHTPMRYLWDMYDDYYRMAGLGGKLALRTFKNYLRQEDLKSAESVDVFIANSHFVADRIRRIYGREAEVVHPLVDIEFFSAPVERSATVPDEPYYLWAGALTDYKRLDLARAACARMGRKLMVVHNCRSRSELRSLYAGARALLFPGLEDFGIVPVEAQAAGTPVIAYGKGGALETVVADRTGLFFPEQTVESLCGAIEEFERRTWSAADCRANAARFSPAVFRERFLAVVQGERGRDPIA